MKLSINGTILELPEHCTVEYFEDTNSTHIFFGEYGNGFDKVLDSFCKQLNTTRFGHDYKIVFSDRHIFWDGKTPPPGIEVLYNPVLIHFQKKQNTMPQTKYIASGDRVLPVLVERETETMYYISGSNIGRRKVAQDHVLCDTEQEAQTYILDTFKEKIQRAENRLAYLKGEYSELVKKFVF